MVQTAKFGVLRPSIPSATTNITTLNTVRTTSFSTTTTARNAAPAMPQKGREYDPEIKDIAQYVTKPIDSELAVSSHPSYPFPFPFPDTQIYPAYITL